MRPAQDRPVSLRAKMDVWLPAQLSRPLEVSGPLRHVPPLGQAAPVDGSGPNGDGVLLTVRTSKTNQEGDAADVRYLKNGAAKAIRTLRAADADAAPTDRVIGLSPLQIQRRFTAAARAAGIEARVTAHSGRVGLASELTARGASTTEVMLAGNWKTARMVAHYSAGATAERGAVQKYL